MLYQTICITTPVVLLQMPAAYLMPTPKPAAKKTPTSKTSSKTSDLAEKLFKTLRNSYKQTLTNQDMANLLAEKNIQLEFPTNKRFAYCNTNYALLALIIEKVSGVSYAQAMQEMIFKPLGMTHTYVFDYEKDRETAMPSYKGNNIRLAYDYLDAVYGDKNIYSTPRDLLKFDLARNAPTFLSEKLRNQIFKGYSYESKGTKNYGLGTRMIEWEGGQKFFFHNGWWHGNTSSYISLVKENVTIIALSNKFTRNTYAVRKLAPIFGDYPFRFDDEE